MVQFKHKEQRSISSLVRARRRGGYVEHGSYEEKYWVWRLQCSIVRPDEVSYTYLNSVPICWVSIRSRGTLVVGGSLASEKCLA